LTTWGCIIKTRFGIHDGVLDKCTDNGLSILELVGEQSQKEEMLRKISLINDVTCKLVILNCMILKFLKIKTSA